MGDVGNERLQRQIAELGDLELQFESLEVQILRDNYKRQRPLYERRDEITSQITNFWPLVIEQASSMLGFDEYITTEDAHLIAESLRSFTITRPDVDEEPRTIQLRFGFAANQFFEDEVLVKTFVHQKCGEMASEPVGIRWKEGKDLTEGVSAAVARAWEERKKGERDGEGMQALEKLMAKGPSSFFNWFEWTGKHESLGEVGKGDDGEEVEETDIVEVFIHGDELAIQLAEEVYTGATEHFMENLEEVDEDEEDEYDIGSASEDDRNGVQVEVGREKIKRNREDEGSGAPSKKVRK